jgi:nicotinamide mononucleotide adenylyltransferase
MEILKSSRQKIDQASVWMGSANKRAEKKNYWSMFKKKGSSFLLSPDHYSQRSAG